MSIEDNIMPIRLDMTYQTSGLLHGTLFIEGCTWQAKGKTEVAG